MEEKILIQVIFMKNQLIYTYNYKRNGNGRRI